MFAKNLDVMCLFDGVRWPLSYKRWKVDHSIVSICTHTRTQRLTFFPHCSLEYVLLCCRKHIFDRFWHSAERLFYVVDHTIDSQKKVNLLWNSGRIMSKTENGNGIQNQTILFLEGVGHNLDHAPWACSIRYKRNSNTRKGQEWTKTMNVSITRSRNWILHRSITQLFFTQNQSHMNHTKCANSPRHY